MNYVWRLYIGFLNLFTPITNYFYILKNLINDGI